MIVTVGEAVSKIADGATVAVNSSSGLCCPDATLKALGERFAAESHPRNLTLLHPIAAGDMYGIRGVDHLAITGLISRIIAGSYPSGPSSFDPPRIWQMLCNDEIAAYNVPSGILFDMMREAAAKRPGVLTKVGMDTFADPAREGCAMNERAKAAPIVKRVRFEGDDWLFFKTIIPDVAIIRATSADRRGNLTYEEDGAYIGALDLAMAAHNNGGLVIAQVKRIVENESLKPHSVYVPGILVDFVVVAPDQWQTTQTPYDAAISGEARRPLSSFELMEWGVAKTVARRVAQELKQGWVVNLGFGVSANVPRIFLEEGLHGKVTWVIEQGAIGGVPLLDFQFGCSSNAEAIVPSPYQFTYFQAGGFDCSLLSFLEIDASGSVNVSRLGARPHVTAGAGGFVDITARGRRIVFSGMFNAGARMDVVDGRMKIRSEGKIKKLVPQVEQVSFSGPRALMQGQDITYITERCVMRLTPEGLTVTEIAPGISLQTDILDQSGMALKVSPSLRQMDARLYSPEPMGLTLDG